MGIEEDGSVDGAGEKPSFDTDSGALAEMTGEQEMLELPVRVVDADGEPVARAKVTPWALRSSQGHGSWREADERAGVGPRDVFTRKDGTAAVHYPRYRDVEERIRTTSVSVFIDHPDFAYVDSLHIDVPLETNEPHEVQLSPGVPIEIRPLIDAAPADLDSVFGLWSDGRSWQPGADPKKSADDAFRIPAMPLGENSLLLVKLDGDRATHFSRITDLELDVGDRKRIVVPLRPALRIEGILSDNVPRPVCCGRIMAQTLPPAGSDMHRVAWFTWVPVRSDGTFTVDGWPAGEPLQVIALCEGYIAASGNAPHVVKDPSEPEKDPFNRPQVFDPSQKERVEVAMTPLVRCIVTAVDQDGKPVAGVTVVSCPNVHWWNGGSQIYCDPLMRGERLIRKRDCHTAIDADFPQPFLGETDADGKLTLGLPAGSEELAVSSDSYELPVFLGRRYVQVKLDHDETTKVVLHLQPRGTEKLGEWDKLAGVIFGCSTRNGRRICALPGVQKRMDEFAERIRNAKNHRDPQLLSEAYSAVAAAFLDVGDHIEAARWRRKAAEQAAKIAGSEPSTDN